MNKIAWLFALWCILAGTGAASAQAPNAAGLHDPSTPIQCAGRWWVYATGPGVVARSSADLAHWTNEPPVFTQFPQWVHTAVPKAKGDFIWAPEVKYLNGRYSLYYAVSTWGSRTSVIGLMTSPTLDPKSPKYHWTDQGMVVQTTDRNDYNAIDPSLLRDPNGRLWLSFGSFFHGLRLIQLNPKTGKPLPSASLLTTAGTGEASYLAYHGGWYYLFFNVGTCCQGKTSSYNIRVGRARSVVGPYLDKYGVDLRRDGGTLFLCSANGRIGPGQIGIFTDHGREEFSCHEEWDMAYDGGRGGGSVLHVAPLLWRDGWPSVGAAMAGVALKLNTPFELRNVRSGLVMDVGACSTADGAILDQWYAWCGPCQTWTVVPASGGAEKIIGVGSGKALTVMDGELQLLPFTNSKNQLWRVGRDAGGAYDLVCNQGLATAQNAQAGSRLVAAPAWLPEGVNAVALPGKQDEQRWEFLRP